jgi:hypothetical protein
MKRIVVGIVLVFSLAAVLPSSASAAGPVNFYLRFGVLTDQKFTFNPFLWTVGANLDFNLGPALTLSPECDIIVYKFNFNPLWLTPAVLLNFHISSFYAGGGIGKLLVIGEGYELSSDFLLKLNAGFKAGGIKLQAYIWTPLGSEAFKLVITGATFGFGF